MKLKKILFVSAAVAAMAGVMATGALADETMSATWNAETQSVDIVGCTDKGDANTILVLATDDEGKVLTSVTQDDIKQIDEQSDAYTTVKVGDLPAGTYEVRVGGDGTLQSALFTVSGDPDNPYADSTRLIGDVNDSGAVDIFDVPGITNHATKLSILTGESLQAADANDNGDADIFDVSEVVSYSVKLPSKIDGVTTIAEKENYVPEATE